MTYLNDLFFDSIMNENKGMYSKYKYVTKEMGNYIWTLIDYFEIEF